MSKRLALLTFAIVVVALLVAGGWLLHQRPEAIVAPTTARLQPERSELPAPPPAHAVEPQHGSTEEPTTSRRWSDGAFFVRREVEKTPSTEGSKTIAIDGVVIVIDSLGIEHREESGTLTPQFHLARRGEDVARLGSNVTAAWLCGEEVTVTAGRFHVDVPAGRQFGAQKAILGGRAAQGVGDPVDVVEGRRVTVRAKWIDGIRLHVVDATSKIELDDVTVVHERDEGFSTASYPGTGASHRTAIAHAASPVDVYPADNDFGDAKFDRFLVGAAGHAWAPVDLRFEQETEAKVELDPAATLVVTVDGELPRRAPSSPPTAVHVGRSESSNSKMDDESGPRLCLREKIETKGDHRAILDPGEIVILEPAAAGEARLDGLAPGDFTVSVEVGDEWSSPLVAGEAAVKLVAGETTRVALFLRSVRMAEPVPLAGTLFIPDGWSTKNLSLKIVPLDLPGKTRSDERNIGLEEMVALPGRSGWFQWNAGDVPPATYDFFIEAARIVFKENVGLSGNENVELKIPEPATLIVHVVDEASGRPVELNGLTYESTPDRSRFGGFATSKSLDYDGDHGRFVAQVPVGAGILDAFTEVDWTLDEATAQVEVHAGSQEITLRVHRACGVLVALSCGVAKIDWPDDLGWDCRIEPVDGGGHSTWITRRDGVPRLGVSAPGRYRVTMPEIPGYTPVAPFEVDVPAGEFITHTVDLKRK